MKNVIIDAALELHSGSYRENSHQVDDTTENPMMKVKAMKNFLRNIKYFIFKNTVLFMKIQILIFIKIRTNNLMCFYFIILLYNILHSTRE